MATKRAKTEKGKPDEELRSRPPAPNQRRLPLFSLHDSDFEELLTDVAEHEPGVVRAELKRRSGLAQYGVDVEGFSDDQKPTLVISCKCYQKIQPADLTTWGVDFLKHLDGHWRDKDVKRFVLAVTVELNNDDLNNRIAVETATFKAKGIQYEVWGLKKLTDKLRPLPFAIRKFLHPTWLEMIGAGTAFVATTSVPASNSATSNSAASAVAVQALQGVPDAVRKRLGNTMASRLDDALRRLREGVGVPLRSLANEIRRDRLSWDALTDDVKAKFLRAEGSLAIRDGDIATATERYEEANAYALPPDRTGAALLARLEANLDAALRLVDTPKTSSEASIRAGLLIEAGKPEEAISVLDAWPSTSSIDDAHEPERLRSIALLWQDRAAALAVITAVERVAPREFALQWAAAVVRFNFALSSRAEPILSSFPNPLSQALVRDTEDARNALDEAASIFDLLSRSVDAQESAADLKVWQLACLILNSTRAGDSAVLAAALLEGEDLHPAAVVWATSAGLAFNQDDVVRTLNAKLKAGTANASHAVAIAYLTATRGAKDRALSALRRHRKLFSEDPDIGLIDYWIGMLSSDGGDDAAQRFNQALARLRKSADAHDVVAMLDAGNLDAEMEMAAYENLAINGKWFEVNTRRAPLLTFGTSQASEIAIRAAFALNLHRDVISLASELAVNFSGSKLPTALGVLVARSQLWEGDAGLALRALEEMRKADSSDELAFEDAIMRLRIGDLSGAAAVIRGRQAPENNPETILKIASELRFEDPDLARRLLEGISFSDLNQTLLPGALGLANELGLRAAAAGIMPRLFGPDAEPSGGIKIDSVEEAIRITNEYAERRQKADAYKTEKWLNVEIPSHLVFDGSPADMAWFFHRPFIAPPKLRLDGAPDGKPFLVRSGVRQASDTVESQVLLLDVTACLIGHELGLLEHIEHVWERVLLPLEAPELLRAMEQDLEQQFRHISDEATEIRKRLETGKFALTTPPASAPRLLVSSDQKDDVPSVLLSTLLAHLVEGGLDEKLAQDALDKLSAPSPAADAPLTGALDFMVVPRDLISLLQVGLLDRLMEDVNLFVEQSTQDQWLINFDHHIEGRALADKIKELRQLVASKANAGEWHFIPVGESAREELENSGAADRILMSLIKSAEMQECEIWSEDRMLSLLGRAEKATIIDVATVLRRLSQRIGEQKCIEVKKRLRRAGYGFLLPDANDIVDALLAAPVKFNALVETDSLAAFRRDFAIQFSNSRYLTDKSGEAVSDEPELLFLSRLLGLAGKVIAELWSRPNIEDQTVSAAASWAACHLRVEQASFLPRENRSLEGREGLLYLHHLSLLGAMFNVTGTSFREARERRIKFLTWVLGNIVEPALETHPFLRPRLVEYLAKSLAHLGRIDANYPGVTQEMLTGVVQNYLQSFPDDWRQELQRHAHLSNLVVMREIEVVGIGENFSFEADEFYTAVAEARSIGQSTLNMQDSKGKAVISRVPDAEQAQDRPVAFKVEARGEIERFSDDKLELEAADIKSRRRGLERHPEWFDMSASEFAAAVQEIAQNSDARVRRKMLSEAQAGAVSWRQRRLGDQISKMGSSDKELLLPPGPESVRRHLRLLPPVNFADTTWFQGAFMDLESEFGSLGALARLGGIPFEVGVEVRKSVLAAVREVGIEKALRVVGPTPMPRTALLAILLADGTQNVDLYELTGPWKDYGGLFHALLRLSFNSAARRDEWRQVAEPERSVLLWAHANAVLEVLMRQRAEPKEATRIVDGFMKQRTDDAQRRSRLLLGHLTDPFETNWRQIASIAIAYAIRNRATRDLDAAQLGHLRDAVARQVEEDWLLEFQTWMPSVAAEPHGCWLSVDPAGVFAAAGVGVLPSPIDERDPNKMVLLLVQRIVEEAANEETSVYWPLIWLRGAKALNDEARAAVKAILGAPDRLPDIAAQNEGRWGGLLRYRAEIYGIDGDIDLFRRTLVAGARQAQHHHSREKVSELTLGSPAGTTFYSLTEAVWQYSSTSSSNLTKYAARFAELIVILSEAWPSSLLGCIALLDRIASQLDTESAGSLWDAINLLRAR